MPKVEQRFVIVPIVPDEMEATRVFHEEAAAALEHAGFMLHDVVSPAADDEGGEIVWRTPDGRQGPCERREYRKTLDYNREERRAAKRIGQTLEANRFKSILPAGWRVIHPDDPTLQDPPPAAREE